MQNQQVLYKMITWEPSQWSGWSDRRLAKERSSWYQDEHSTFVHCRQGALPVSRASENSLGNWHQFGFRMFKTITRAIANPSKRLLFRSWTCDYRVQRRTPYSRATVSINLYLFLNLNCELWKYFCVHVVCALRSARTLVLSPTVKIWLGDIDEICLQGLNLLSTHDSAPNHDLALLQPDMNLVGMCLAWSETQALMDEWFKYL